MQMAMLFLGFHGKKDLFDCIFVRKHKQDAVRIFRYSVAWVTSSMMIAPALKFTKSVDMTGAGSKALSYGVCGLRSGNDAQTSLEGATRENTKLE